MTIGSYIQKGGTVMYKTILVHIDETARSAQRAELASRLAVLYDAHLVGAAMTGLRSYLLPVGEYGVGFDALGLAVAQVRADANRALDLFETCARGAGVASVERRCIDEEPGIGISLQARYCDLVVISQTDPDQFLQPLRSGFPDYVLLNAPRPVLVLPLDAAPATLGQRITVAWNGSAEAVRAIASALPLLQRARKVNLVVFDADISGDLHGEVPGADIALYLARHGVPVEVTSGGAGIDEGASLLSFAGKNDADLIVMGAYGHSRFREILLGGMTRSVLASSTIPLWMSH
jgi:nucleotide-binding universal stress UspA family protein